MGNVLHDWGLEDKKMLIRKAYDPLTKGRALVVIENIIDDNRSENAFGLMMSLIPNYYLIRICWEVISFSLSTK